MDTPSHASIFTGEYPSQHYVYGSSPLLEIEKPTLAERLSENGYSTFGFSNSFHTSRERGFSNGFDYYHDLTELRTISGKRVELSKDYLKYALQFFLNEESESYFQIQKLLTTLSNNQPPFFGFINISAAHYPYSPASKHNKYFKKVEKHPEVDIDIVQNLAQGSGFNTFMMGEVDATERDIDAVQRLYDGELAYADELVGKVVKNLKDQGRYDDTLLIVTSDHGELLGEENKIGHQFSIHERLLNVPLIVKWPNSAHTGESDRLVSLIDLYPTILRLAINKDGPKGVGNHMISGDPHEVVFAEYDRPFPPIRKRLYNQFGEDFKQFDVGFQVAHTGSWKFVKDTDDKETFYRVNNGNQQKAKPPQRIQSKLRKSLEEILNPLPAGGEIKQLNQRTKDHLERLGYL